MTPNTQPAKFVTKSARAKQASKQGKFEAAPDVSAAEMLAFGARQVKYTLADLKRMAAEKQE
jgi:hypothetical protein